MSGEERIHKCGPVRLMIEPGRIKAWTGDKQPGHKEEPAELQAFLEEATA